MQLIYNSIDHGWILTHSVRQEAEYSDDMVDYLWTKVSIEVRAYLNIDVSPPSALGDNNPADIMNGIRMQLLTPRKQLKFRLASGADFITVPPTNCTGDANNGPKPRYCNITQVNEETWIIEYAIDCWIIECGRAYDGSGQCTNDTSPFMGKAKPSIVLSNRYAVEMEIDQQHYTKRHVHGTMRLLANSPDYGPDNVDIRFLTLPPIPNNFLRTNMKWAVSTDMTKIEYSFTDVEQYCNPPSPLTKWEAEYVAENKTMGAGKYPERITVRAWADRCTTKSAVLVAAMKIAVGRLFGIGGFTVPADENDPSQPNIQEALLIGMGLKQPSHLAPRNGFIMPQSKMVTASYIRDHMHENYVEVYMETLGDVKAKQTPYGVFWAPNLAANGAASNMDYMIWDNQVTDNAKQTASPGVGGTAMLTAIRHLYDATCNGQFQKPDTNNPNEAMCARTID